MRDLNMLLDDRTAWRLPEVGACSASLRRSKEMLNGGSPAGEGCGSLWMDLKAEEGGGRRAGVGVGAELGCRPGASPHRSVLPPVLSAPRAPAVRGPGLRLPVPPGSGACPLRDPSSVFQARALLYLLSHFQSSPPSPAPFSLPRDVCHLMPLKRLLCFERNLRCT